MLPNFNKNYLRFELKLLHKSRLQRQHGQSSTSPQLKFGKTLRVSLILGRPKEFSGKEKDFQQWSKKKEAFFTGVIKESEMMLKWTAEQTTESTAELINREFLPTATNQERGAQNLEFVLQQMHAAVMALTSYEANDIVANSRKNPLEAWRRLQK